MEAGCIAREDMDSFQAAMPMERHEIQLRKSFLDQWRDFVGRYGVHEYEANLATKCRVDAKSGDLFLSMSVDDRIGDDGIIIMKIPRFGRNSKGVMGPNWELACQVSSGLVQ